MSTIDKTHLAGQYSIWCVDEDPAVVSTGSDVSENPQAGDLIIYQQSSAYGVIYLKLSDGVNTDVAKLITKDNLSSATDPGVNNDISEGYSIGSVWHNNSSAADLFYRCVDNSDGAAQWLQMVSSSQFSQDDFLIDSDGKITIKVDVSAAQKQAVSDATERLSLPQISNLYIVAQTDVEKIYYLNANTDPSVDGNWVEGPSTAESVTSIQPVKSKSGSNSTAQTGIILVERGWMTGNEMVLIDQGSLGGGSGSGAGTPYILEIRNGVLGIKELNSTNWEDS